MRSIFEAVKIHFMKAKIILPACAVFIALAATSCTADDCGYCKTVTYENNVIVQESAETEYCGLDLITQESRQDVKTGSQVTKTECR